MAERGVTAEELSRLGWVNINTLHKVLGRHRPLPPTLAVKLATALDLPAEELLVQTLRLHT